MIRLNFYEMGGFVFGFFRHFFEYHYSIQNGEWQRLPLSFLYFIQNL